MKHFLKGAAVTAVVLIILMVINVICNMNGINLDSVPIGVLASICAMSIYQALIRNENKKDDQE